MSLSRPPYNFFGFSQSLFLVGFLKLSLKRVYPTIGIDGKRYKKIGKDRNRCRKMGKDTKRWGKIVAVLKNPGELTEKL